MMVLYNSNTFLPPPPFSIYIPIIKIFKRKKKPLFLITLPFPMTHIEKKKNKKMGIF